MSGPLAGIKVLDLCQYANGPVATGQLADQGATVVKLEPPEGEGQRHTTAPGYFNPMLEVGSRGKRSITLDLKHPGAVVVMKKLCEWADVLAENFRPGILEKLGFGYDLVSKWNPKLIYASNSGLGSKGEWATRPSYDGVGQAFSGILTANAGGPSHRPREVPWVFSDIVGGNNFYAGILAALVARGRTGLGQHVVTSQAAAGLQFQQHDIWRSWNYSVPAGGQDDSGDVAWRNWPWQHIHQAADSKWIAVSMIQRQQFERFCKVAMKRPDLFKPELTRRWPGAKPEDTEWLKAEVAAEVKKQPVDYWLRALVEANVPCAPVATYADIGDETTAVGRHFRANGLIAEINHRDYGKQKIIAPPVSFSGTPNRSLSAEDSVHAPDIGEHNAEMLREVGFSDTEASDISRDGVMPPPKGPFERQASEASRQKFLKAHADARAADAEQMEKSKL